MYAYKGLNLRTSSACSYRAMPLLMQGVVAEVTARFAAQAAEMLVTLRKTESSLQRLRQSRTAADAGGDGAGAVSNTDKVGMQLFLDAQVGCEGCPCPGLQS